MANHAEDDTPKGSLNGVAHGALNGVTGPTNEVVAVEAAPGAGAGEDSYNKRKHARASLSLLVQYRFNTLEEFLAEYSIDISVGGMFIRTEKPRPEGSMIYLQFALRDGIKLIEGLGKVVRVNPPGGVGTPGMGVEFVNLDADSAELIEEIVGQKQSKKTHP